MTIDAIILKMQEYYIENGKDRPLQYIYGFMDALSVIRDIQNKNRN